MRVTGGILRSRKIETPQGPLVEPVPDMVREAVFSILQHVVPEARVLDLFACSGSLGIEAISRGARTATFVEKDASNARVLTRNLITLGIADRAEVIVRDALTVLPYFTGREDRFDLVFLDPPYSLSDDRKTLTVLENLIASFFDSGVLGDGIVIFRQRGDCDAVLSGHASFTRDTRTYGTTQVTFVEKA